MRQLFFLSVFFFIISACSKSEASSEAKAENLAVTMAQITPAYKSAGLALPDVPKKIIKNASIKFETDDLEKTFQQIQNAIKANQGSILNDSEGKDYNTLYRNITVKVPSQNFDSFIIAISKGVSFFERKDISATDVTAQYIDLTSRLKTKKKLEERYIEILQKATKVSEILEIEKQISAIREEIEAKEGELKYLENQVSLSTVTIEFYKTIAQKEGVKISYGSKLWTAVKSGFFSLSDFLISLISVWPFVILFVVFAYFIRKRLKRRKKE
ncbi:MAG: DUF4349 domain-containing protein [Flavobacterium nitrogenifigens]|uniref:DUF4349 domain-containing protein n=1 Tax=Flavobacterium nitrogenifigens TaxID=1617283 RepID=UPI002808FB51|nr:DUF4349 domain-containing protein [Flavobacterium nitrogenifigens]MDQ8011179.1 DUF4349 domain-containing protein [Flavobacterium nitrogenifigens]